MDILISLFISLGANYIYDMFGKDILSQTYQRALDKWSRNNAIREEMAKHEMSHLKRLHEYILKPESIKEKEVAELLMLWEKELIKEKNYIIPFLVRNNLVISNKNAENINELKRLCVNHGDILQSILKDIDLLKQKSYFGSKIIDCHIDDYIPRKINYVFQGGIEYGGTTLWNCITGREAELINQNKFILLAPAQSGKTTELKKIAWELQQSEFFHPFFYEAKKYTSDINLHLFFHFEKIENKKTVLIIDALDEFPDNIRTNIEECIKEIENDNSDVIILISCRSNYDNRFLFSSYIKLYFESLSINEVGIYLSKYSERPHILLKYIKNNNLEEILIQPFYLKSLISYYNDKNSLPYNKYELYKYWIDNSFDISNRKYKIFENNFKDKYKDLISRIAIVLQLKNATYLKEEELYKIFTSNRDMLLLSETEQLLLCCATPIFIKGQRNIYMFENVIFKEYFVALHLMKLPFTDIETLISNERELGIKESWYNIIILYLSFLGKEDKRYQEAINWIKKYHYLALLDLPVSYFDKKERNELFFSIATEYIKSGNLSQEVVQKLVLWGYSLQSAKFLIEQYNTFIEIEDYDRRCYINRIFTMLYFFDWQRLSVTNNLFVKEFEELLFSKIYLINNQEVASCFLEILKNNYFQRSEIIEKIYEVANSFSLNEQQTGFQNAKCVKIFFDLIGLNHLVDKYIDFIIEIAEIYKIDGEDILSIIIQSNSLKAFVWALDLPSTVYNTELQITHAIKLYPRIKRICYLLVKKYIEACYPNGKLSPDYRKFYYSDVFFLYKSFFYGINNREHWIDVLIERIININLPIEKRIESSRILALFLKRTDVDRLFDRMKSSSYEDYTSCKLILNEYDANLYEYELKLFCDKYSDFISKDEDIMNGRIISKKQKEINHLLNYSFFKEDIINIVNILQNNPDFWVEDRYVDYFILHYSSDQEILFKSLDAIENKQIYNDYVIEHFPTKLINLELSLDQKQVLSKLVRSKLGEALRLEKYDYTFEKALELFNCYEFINIPEEYAIKLITKSYGNYSRRSKEELLRRLREYIDKNKFKNILFQELKKGNNPIERLGGIYTLLFIEYLHEEYLEQVYPIIVSEILRTDKCEYFYKSFESKYQVELWKIMVQTSEGVDLIIDELYDQLSDLSKLNFISCIFENEKYIVYHKWIHKVLEPNLYSTTGIVQVASLIYSMNTGAPYALKFLKREIGLFREMKERYFNAPWALKHYTDVTYLDDILCLSRYFRDSVLQYLKLIANQSYENYNIVIAKMKEKDWGQESIMEIKKSVWKHYSYTLEDAIEYCMKYINK